MNNIELTKKVHQAVASQCQTRGYATVVDVLMDIGILSKQNYTNWRNGKVAYLEQVCNVNLSKLALVLIEIRVRARQSNLTPSLTSYNRWGKKGGPITLRFSKSGQQSIENQYATHFLDRQRIAELKELKDNAIAKEVEQQSV